MFYGAPPDLYSATALSTGVVAPLSAHPFPAQALMRYGGYGGYGADYGASSIEVQIGTVEAKISRESNPRRRRRLQRKLQHLMRKAAKMRTRGRTKRVRYRAEVEAAGGKKTGTGILYGKKGEGLLAIYRRWRWRGGRTRRLSRRLSRRQARLQARLARRLMRQMARGERKSARQAMKDSGQPMDPIQNGWFDVPESIAQDVGPSSGEYMETMDSGIISDPSALPGGGAAMPLDSYDDDGLPWGKIALGLGIVVALGVGLKMARKKKKGGGKKKKASRASAPATPPPRTAL